MAAHRVAADDDALGVDVVVLSHRRNHLIDVGLRIELVRMIHPGERLDHDVVVGEDLRCLMRARLLLQEADFVVLLLRAVQPDVEAHRPLAVVGRRYGQPVGLEAAVDARDEAAHDVAGLPRPRRRAVLELDGASDAGVERGNRLGRVVRPEELVRKAQDVLDRLLVDVHVGEKLGIGVLRPEGGEARAQLGELLVNLGFLLGGRRKHLRALVLPHDNCRGEHAQQNGFLQNGHLSLLRECLGFYPTVRLKADTTFGRRHRDARHARQKGD